MKKNFFKNKSFLITGGTGTFGKEALKFLSKKKGVKKIVLFARDEHKFHDLEDLIIFPKCKTIYR